MANLSLAFDLLVRDKGAAQSFRDIGSAADDAGRKGERFGNLVKGGVAVAAGAIATLGIGSFLKDATTAASDLAETVNKSNVIFGKNAGTIKKWAGDAARNIGLSEEAALDAAAGFGNMFTQLGFSADSAADLSTEVVELSADLGSFNNLPTADVAERISAAFRGEYDSLQLLIPNINDARVKTEALAMTGKDNADALTAQEKAAAILKIVNEDGAAAAGDFAETQDNLANKTKIAAAMFDDLKAALGERLLPIAQDVMGWLTDTALPAIDGFLGEVESGEGAGGAFARGLDAVRTAGTNLRDYIVDHVVPALQTARGYIVDNVVPALETAHDYIRDHVIPKLEAFASVFTDDVDPAMRDTQRFLVDTFTPTLEAFVGTIRDDVVPAGGELKGSWDENKSAIGQLVGGLIGLHLKITGVVWPLLIEFAGWLSSFFLRAFSMAGDSVTAVRDLIVDLRDWFKFAREEGEEFMDILRGFKLPGWIQTLVDAMKTIGGGFSDGKERAIPGLGDGPGRYAGGNTLNRIKSMLPAGAAISSTYRTPAQNAAVGGVPGSYHTDRSNPAVDIVGSMGVLDRLYAQLRAVGGWRELLWRVPGHFDHLHVAHNGGKVSAGWPTVPGLRPDERPVIAQIGEDIIPKNANRGGPTINVTVNAEPGVAREYASYAAREASTRMRDALAVHGLSV